MDKLKKKVKNDLNEIVFCLYFLIPLLLLIISNYVGSNIYKILFFGIGLVLLIFSLLKNKRILTNKDLIVLSIILFSFFIDRTFRKNIYTTSTYIDICKVAFASCYFYNRTSNSQKIIEYLSFFYKIFMIIFLFDPLFHYFFTGDYMVYGYHIMLPAVISIYFDYLINRDKTNLIFVFLGLIGLFFFANRLCILAFTLAFIMTIMCIKKLNKSEKRKSEKKLRIKYKQIIKKSVIVIALFNLSFGLNFVVTNSKLFSNKKNKSNDVVTEVETNKPANNQITEENVENNIDNTKEEDSNSLNFESYSVNKYKEALSGNYSSLFSGRIEIYEKALKVIKNDIISRPITLLFGRGIGYFRLVNDNVYTHNIFLDFIIQFGFVGLTILLSLLMYIIFKLKKLYRDDKKMYLLLVFVFCLSFPKLLFSSEFFKETSFFLIFLIMLTKYPINLKRK